MTYAPQHFDWSWELDAPPAALWPLVANTDRFNRDCGYPGVVEVPAAEAVPPVPVGARRLRTQVMGIVIAWDERPFAWLAPHHFEVERIYHSGPVARMRVLCELAPLAGGRTSLRYQTWITPANLLGRLALPLQLGRKERATFGRVFRHYAGLARRSVVVSDLAQRPHLAPGATDRLQKIRGRLSAAGQSPEIVALLVDHLTRADDLAVTKMRPYALADEWRQDRRAVLPLFLHSTRAGLLDFSWDILCPLCRGASVSTQHLSGVRANVHCPTCRIDYTANFDQSVELTFSPNRAIRNAARPTYCVGGPQVTPHVVAQQQLGPGETRLLPLALPAGRYRLRSPQLGGQIVTFRVEAGGAPSARLELGAAASSEEISLALVPRFEVINPASDARLVIVEHLAWSDQATTAVEVTALQLFRDLFVSEVLRPEEQISVGHLTVVFTDLKDSTQLYRAIGDAPAFGRVLTHFEILKTAVDAEGGAIVKTMGDAVMAVFPRPVAALRAVLTAQHQLAHPESPLTPLALKAAMHTGACIAINQNNRLDYFGTTVNIAARLCALCYGPDVVLSAAAASDTEVAAYLGQPTNALRSSTEHAALKGFPDETFELRRITAV